jgi:hypothetical protein
MIIAGVPLKTAWQLTASGLALPTRLKAASGLLSPPSESPVTIHRHATSLSPFDCNLPVRVHRAW